MELTVYRQAIKTNRNGKDIYKGEDVRPYVDDQLFIVADGMGGASSIFHTKIVPELLESEKLMDVLFTDVYEDYRNETFVKYVLESFSELFAVKECYQENENYSIYNIKKGGYFASRIVAAIILHEMLYNDEYKAEKIFSTLSACEDQEAKKSYLNEIGSHFKNLIQTKIKQIAKNANLIYESGVSNLALLGTTLCSTIYFERENCVEAIYLTAGDSRPYVWSEKNGLSQVLKDQEAEDERVTNYICANEDADFTIQCDYFSFEKPCILFNASDGCFDSKKFQLSQLAFEKLILEGAIASEDTEKMSEYLTTFFLDWGRHDDSSTIAMKMFGYETFDALKASCQKRLNVLQMEYFDKMEDLLDTDHISAYEECERTFPGQLAALKEKFFHEAGVMDFCTEYILSGKYQPHLDRVSTINQKIASEEERISAAKSAISNIIAENYVKFKDLVDCETNVIKKLELNKIQKKGSNLQTTSEAYVDQIETYKKEFDETIEELSILLENIYKIGVPTSFEDFDKISLQCVEDCEKKMERLFDFFDGLRSKKLYTVKTLTAQRQAYIRDNRAFAAKNPQKVEQLCSMIVSGELDVSTVGIREQERAEIANMLTMISETEAQILQLKIEREGAVEKSGELYWETQYVDVILAVIDDPKYVIDEALANEARTIIQEFKEKTNGVKENCEKQKALFEKYNATYCMYMGGVTDDSSRI